MASIDIDKLTPAIETGLDAGMTPNVAGYFQVTQGNESVKGICTCDSCRYFDFEDDWDNVYFWCTHPIASDKVDLFEMDWNTVACEHYAKE